MQANSVIQYPTTEPGADAMMNASDERSLAGLRIIMVGNLEFGGAERQALQLAQYLTDEEKAKVEFWGLGAEDGVVSKAFEDLGVPWRVVPVNWFTQWKGGKVWDLARLALALRRARPDVILSYLIVPNVACGLVWRWTGARLCIWNQRCAGFSRLGARVEQLAVQRVPWFVSNSQAGAEFLTGTLGAPPDRVRVIHNGIQLAKPGLDRTAWRQELGLNDDTFAVCMVANLNIYKDHKTLLRSWKFVIDKLESEGRSAVLLLAGRYNDEVDALKAMAFELNLGSQSVRFLGRVQDVSGLLGASDLTVLSSPSEGSPNAILEAMAIGLAAVGTDNPGMREVLGPDGYQFLAPPGDAAALADRILCFAIDHSLREKVGAANKQRVAEEFNPRRTCKQMASVIVEGLQEKKFPVNHPVQNHPQPCHSQK